MELPPYLLRFLLELRRHDKEPGYFKTKYEGKGYDEALSARLMYAELVSKRYVAAWSNANDVVRTVLPDGTTKTVTFTRVFFIAPKGHRAGRLLVLNALFWVVTICLAQQLPSLVPQLLQEALTLLLAVGP